MPKSHSPHFRVPGRSTEGWPLTGHLSVSTRYLSPIPPEREVELNDVYMTVASDTVQRHLYLTPTPVGPGPVINLVVIFSASVKKSKQFIQCASHGSIDILPPFVSPDIKKHDVGREVTVDGYSAKGLLQFFGMATNKKEQEVLMCGVVFDKPVGLHNGTAGGKTYFVCKQKHGVMVTVKKVHLQMPYGRFSTWGQATKDAVQRLQELDITESKVNVKVTKTAIEIRNLKCSEIWLTAKYAHRNGLFRLPSPSTVATLVCSTASVVL